MDQPSTTRCHCHICVRNGENTSGGTTEGAAPVSALLASVIFDSGPDMNMQPSRLWISRDEYQVTSTSQSQAQHLPDDATVTKEIWDSVRRLQSSQDTHPAAFILAPKREKHKSTKLAHICLDDIELRAKNCQDELDGLDEQRREDTLDMSSSQSLEIFRSLHVELKIMQAAFKKVKRDVDSINVRKDAIGVLVHDIQERLERWGELYPAYKLDERLEEDPEQPFEYDCSHLHDHPFTSNHYDQVTLISMFIVVVCRAILGVSRRLGDLILGLVAVLLQASFRHDVGDHDLKSWQQKVLKELPVTSETVMDKFKLDGKKTIYAVCPQCHCTYRPVGDPEMPTYPERCSNKPSPDRTCRAVLLEYDSKGHARPLKTFVYYSFHDYLAALLARPDIEKMMDASCDRLMKSIRKGDPPPEFVEDIFQGEFIRTFEGPHEGELFVDRTSKAEGRYLFALNVDFFHSEGQTPRSATVSSGLISMACVNLPLDIRYKPENMYVGIIAGPKHPSTTQLNHYIRPLVDDMAVSWQRGVRYSRTAKYRTGRPTRSAIVLSVNDLQATRQLNAYAGTSSHHFCTICECFHLSELNRTDTDSPDWHPRDIQQLRKHAEDWRSASTDKIQETLFSKTGVRWTELWRLPYWDPTRMLVVDSMHCLLEGLVHHHFRRVLCLQDPKRKAKVPMVPAFKYEFELPDDDYKSDFPADANHITLIHKTLISPLGVEDCADEGDESGADEGVKNVADNVDDDEQQEDDLEQIFSGLQKRLETRRLNALQFVVTSVGATIPETDDPRRGKSKPTRALYAQALVNWRKQFPLQADGDEKEETPMSKFGTPVVMERIRKVIQEMDTPSWLRSVPYNFGLSAAGSIKADEWRTLATVYLPVALVSVWGEGTNHGSEDNAASLRQVLDHTMDLVCAVSLACMNTTTPIRVASYHRYILSWVSMVRIIHPNSKLSLNYHMAIHICDFLRLFGPVRSWWCFPFERLIGHLQRLPHNHKAGDLEATMVATFTKAARLRQWLARPDSSPFLKECKSVFDKAFASRQSDGEHTPSNSEPARTYNQSVPAKLKPLINEARVHLPARYKDEESGFVYSRATTHIGNSLIMFYRDGNFKNTPVPGSIQYIIETVGKSPNTRFAVSCQLPAPPGSVDPFIPYVDFPAKIFSTQLSPTLEIVEPDWIFSHYARWKMDAERAVILTLSRD